MTSVKESLRRLFQDRQGGESERSEFAYTVYWTSVVRSWDEEKRVKVRGVLEAFVSGDEFEETLLERRYQVGEVDGEEHSGVSLRVLLQVLEAFE
jgi:hypothetical protein